MRDKNYVVIGHENPDVDSIISCILYQAYMQQKGYLCVIKIPDGAVDADTKNSLLSLGIDVNNYFRELAPTDVLHLVDHHETSYPNSVISCIDHHPTVKTYDYAHFEPPMAEATGGSKINIESRCSYSFD